jgi:hypothetical protein
LPAERLGELRRRPGPGPGEVLTPAFLKQSDEQTVAGLAAVCHAAVSLGPCDFTQWGVVAAPRFPGRPAFVHAVERFKVEGAWAVSPHYIPHRSLHSLAGTISLALKARGPNFGAGGVADALLTAVALLDDPNLAGVWVVLTALDPEPHLDTSGIVPGGTHLAALVLALKPATDPSRPRLTVAAGERSLPRLNGTPDVFRLAELLAALRTANAPIAFVESLEGGGRVELASARPDLAPLVRVAAEPVGAGGSR